MNTLPSTNKSERIPTDKANNETTTLVFLRNPHSKVEEIKKARMEMESQTSWRSEKFDATEKESIVTIPAKVRHNTARNKTQSMFFSIFLKKEGVMPERR